ncbi:TPA: NYN domain-containing protein [Citrobacter freundii]|uniref:NYN domain-containing protein n=1 Tax=Citrobacter freundii TaxID=546 RepID=UPI001B81B867|nr:NYN domain-containing protein [Citrobacter freundii]HBC2002096.1 NYN domain-containing protein [Citrobacter freundii]HBM8410807.1 NYN domain-containing protein [Citrobacter freundii]HBM9448544.1 NYN domain-containing protein [Citrobacter freundii]HCC4672023.1 NYN domain-containing protein [Citrobacter freundii]
MSDETSKKLAVLIDADNAQASLCNELFSEISKYGLANVKRAYGDWTTTNLKGWKEHLHKHAIQPIQQFSYTTGKNSTDSSLIIDAMDLLHEGNLDGFCLISSDSDFTRLANRLRESGIIVYGFGEEKTPDAFISACNLFIKTENLRKTKTTKDFSDDADLNKLICNALTATSKDDGWSLLSAVGSYITKNEPSFDSRTYGYEKLGGLVKSLTYLKTETREVGGVSHLHVTSV